MCVLFAGTLNNTQLRTSIRGAVKPIPLDEQGQSK